jgi:glutathione synthase/RimK-type ligase-like ATP-grasp enzyme
VPESYDIVISSPFPNYDYFSHRMMELCGQMNLDFFFVNDVWIKEFTKKVKAGDVEVRVLLDLTANQPQDDDPYTILAKAVKQRGGYVMDDPEKTAEVAHKGKFHQILVERGVPVPETVVVERKKIGRFKITDEIKERVGVPFVVKPAWGDSGIGVVMNSRSEDDLKRSAKEAPNSDAFLIQQMVTPKQLGEHVGWFRMYYICGRVIPCWWNPHSHEYHLVTPGQQRRHKLAPLKRVMRGIAQASKMAKFSAEIVMLDDGKFVAVDYVNADPDMNPRSFYRNGVPDEVVRYIVWLLFHEGLRYVKKRQGFFDEDLFEAEGGWLEQRKLQQSVEA